MIKIEITGTNPLEVFAQTTVYGMKLMQIPEVSEATDLVLAMEKNWKNTQAAQTTDMGNPITPSKAPAAPAEPPVGDKPAGAPTMEEVRAKGVAAGQKHGNAAVKPFQTSTSFVPKHRVAKGT